jgi:hypothetical protein
LAPVVGLAVLPAGVGTSVEGEVPQAVAMKASAAIADVFNIDRRVTTREVSICPSF